MQKSPDPRYFQVLFQLVFLCYGIFYLEWSDWSHYFISISGCLLFNYSAESIRQKKLLPFFGKTGWNLWGFSVLISAMSLCLLLKTNHWYTSLFACFLTVTSKYIFRFGKKHIFNPSAFGIAATLLITGDAWLSPGQWGSNAILFFLIAVLGTIVVTRVQKLDTSLAFILTFTGLLYWRQIFVLGWPLDHFIHSISTGSLLLFGFFMISDPKTSPNHRLARIIWAMGIAIVAFYLTAFKWIYNTPIWVLVAAAPIVPLLDRIFSSKPFEWSSVIHPHTISKLKKNNHEIV
jgi:Na+-transporting NADH:ubiquinone oxidoreductase subunit NqrB